MSTARDCAFEILQKMERNQAYSTVSLHAYFAKTELSHQDIQLATALVFGVTERKITLDYFLSKQLSQPIKKLKPQVLTVLRIGAYQLLYMDKIPQSAAVNESVKAVKKNGCAFAAGLVNAVLRKVAQYGIVYPNSGDDIFNLSIRYSCPEWLVLHYKTSYGIQKCEQILASAQGSNRLYVRVNTIRTSLTALQKFLLEDGIESEPAVGIENALILHNAGDLTKCKSFNDGLFHVQDYSSQLCCDILDCRPGDFLVDCCAAPGGKSFTSAYKMQNRGRILSCDVHPFKADMISENAKRLGIDCLEAVCMDAVHLKNSIRNADRVLCDVPCSGLGVIGRKPEIRYKSKDEVDKLPTLQYDILNSCSQMVKPGGILVYSTCTLNPAENEEVCCRFLAEHSDFEAVDISDSHFLTVFPDGDKDGFFIAEMKRKAEVSA